MQATNAINHSSNVRIAVQWW